MTAVDFECIANTNLRSVMLDPLVLLITEIILLTEDRLGLAFYRLNYFHSG